MPSIEIIVLEDVGLDMTTKLLNAISGEIPVIYKSAYHQGM